MEAEAFTGGLGQDAMEEQEERHQYDIFKDCIGVNQLF